MKRLKFSFPKLTKRRVALVLFVAFSAIVIILSLRGRSTPVNYITGNVTKGNITKTINASGSVTAYNKQEASFSNPGTSKITEIKVKPGQAVTAGDELAKMETTELQNKVSQAESKLNQARNNYNNTKLMGGRSVSYLDLANLQENIKTAESDYNLAVSNLNSATLRAQFAGIVMAVDMKVGDSAAGEAQIVVIDPNSYYLDISLPETDAVKVTTGMTANVSFESIPAQQYEAELTEITLIPVVTSNVASFPAKVTIKTNDGKINYGISGEVVITLESKQDVLVVPAAAVITRRGESYVRELVNGSLNEIPVKVGMTSTTMAEITEGVSENQTIVISIVTPQTTNTTTNTFGGSGTQFTAPSGTGNVNFGGGQRPATR